MLAAEAASDLGAEPIAAIVESKTSDTALRLLIGYMASPEFLDKVGSVNHTFSQPWLAFTSLVGRESGGGFGNSRGSFPIDIAIDIAVALSSNCSACKQVIVLKTVGTSTAFYLPFELETAALRALSIVTTGSMHSDGAGASV